MTKIDQVFSDVQRNGVEFVGIDKIFDAFSNENEVSTLFNLIKLIPLRSDGQYHTQVTRRLVSISHLFSDLTCWGEFANVLLYVATECGAGQANIPFDMTSTLISVFTKSTLCKLLNGDYHLIICRLLAKCQTITPLMNDEYVEIFNHLKYVELKSDNGETEKEESVAEKDESKLVLAVEKNELIEKLYAKACRCFAAGSKYLNLIFSFRTLSLLYKNGKFDILCIYFRYKFINAQIVRSLVTKLIHPADFECLSTLLQTYPSYFNWFYQSHADDSLFLFLRFSQLDSLKDIPQIVPKQFTRQFLSKTVQNSETKLEGLSVIAKLLELKHYHNVPDFSSTILSLLLVNSNSGQQSAQVSSENENAVEERLVLQCISAYVASNCQQSADFDLYKSLMPVLKSYLMTVVAVVDNNTKNNRENSIMILRILSMSNKVPSFDGLADIHSAWLTLDRPVEVADCTSEIFDGILKKSILLADNHLERRLIIDYMMYFDKKSEIVGKIVNLLKKFSNPVQFYQIIERFALNDIFYNLMLESPVFDGYSNFRSMLVNFFSEGKLPSTGTISIEHVSAMESLIASSFEKSTFMSHIETLKSFPYFQSLIIHCVQKYPQTKAEMEKFMLDISVQEIALSADSEAEQVVFDFEGMHISEILECLADCEKTFGDESFRNALRIVKDCFSSETVERKLFLKVLKRHCDNPLALFILAKVWASAGRQRIIDSTTLIKLIMSHSKYESMISTGDLGGLLFLLNTCLSCSVSEFVLPDALKQTICYRYTYTKSISDQLFEKLWLTMESKGNSTLMDSLDLESIISNIDSKKVFATIHGFDVFQGYYSFPDDLLCKPKNPTIYSSRFLCSLLAHGIHRNYISMETIVDLNLLGFLFRCMSSLDETYRTMAQKIFSLIMTRFSSSHASEKGKVTGANAMKTSNEMFSTSLRQRQEIHYILKLFETNIICSAGGVPEALPSITTVFFAHVVRIMRNPSDPLFMNLNRFILSRCEFDPTDVPMFYELFFQSFPDQLSSGMDTAANLPHKPVNQTFRAGKRFILQLLKHVYTEADLECLQRRKIVHLLGTYGQEYKDEIVEIYRNIEQCIHRMDLTSNDNNEKRLSDLLTIINSCLQVRYWGPVSNTNQQSPAKRLKLE